MRIYLVNGKAFFSGTNEQREFMEKNNFYFDGWVSYRLHPVEAMELLNFFTFTDDDFLD